MFLYTNNVKSYSLQNYNCSDLTIDLKIQFLHCHQVKSTHNIRFTHDTYFSAMLLAF